MGLASRARQNWSKNRKHPQFASLSQANPSPKSKHFFNRTKKTFRIRRGFEHLSNCCGWRVITKKSWATIVALVVVKGLNVFLNFNEQKFGCFLERKSILSCSKYTQRTLCELCWMEPYAKCEWKTNSILLDYQFGSVQVRAERWRSGGPDHPRQGASKRVKLKHV